MSATEHDEAEIDTLLRSLPPVEPPAKAVAATDAALARARGPGRKHRPWMWAAGVMAATVAVALLGVPTVQESDGGGAPPMSDARPQEPTGSGKLQADSGRFHLGPAGAAAGDAGHDKGSTDARREYWRQDVDTQTLGYKSVDQGIAAKVDVPPEPETTVAGNGDTANGRSQRMVDADKLMLAKNGEMEEARDELEQSEALKAEEKALVHEGFEASFGDDGKRKATVEHLDANGYFANTYLPGDPQFAQLRSSLAQGLYRDGDKVRLEELATPVVQPFDAPTERALAITVAADRDAVEGPTRLTLQVGIAGAEVRPTRRAPIAMALIVDLASIVDDAERRSLWGIAEAFVAARQPGDRLSLVVATATGTEVASGADLRGGLGFLASAYERRGGSLGAAVQRAYDEARPDDEVSASVVVLATARPPDARLGAWADDRAVAGTELSVIGVGPRAAGDAIAALAQACEGRRWFVATPDDAARAIDDEIAASGRMVARALRLSLVLGRGVELHGVLGSRPLDNAAADAVRESEVAIDRRVQETTGIVSDRGEDEAGIQIVVPAFMAGDRHVILLDVTVPGPGAALEVRARWKDLVRMDNGAAETALSIGRGDRQDSPAADNVRANRAAFETAKALRAAAAALQRGAVDEARAVLVAAQRDAAPSDRRIFSAYASALASPESSSRSELWDHLVRSLELAAASRLGAH